MTVSNTPTETARNSETLVLRTLQTDVKQTQIAAAMGISATTLSRFKTAHLERFCLMLAHAGLRIVEADAPVVDEEKLRALIVLFADNISADELYKLLVKGAL